VYAEKTMKKTLVILFQLLKLGCVLCADSAYEKIIQKTYPDAREIRAAGSFKEHYLYIVVYENDWHEWAIIYNAHTHKITECNSVDENAVYSARIIQTPAAHFVEIVGMTHMGNGRIHLLDFNGTEFFSYVFLDCHYESNYFDTVSGIAIFKHYKPEAKETYGRVIKDDVLHIDYSRFDGGFIRIFGTVAYLAENEKDDSVKCIGTVDIERLFKKRVHKNAFSQSLGTNRAGGERPAAYELIKKTGELDTVFGYDF